MKERERKKSVTKRDLLIFLCVCVCLKYEERKRETKLIESLLEAYIYIMIY